MTKVCIIEFKLDHFIRLVNEFVSKKKTIFYKLYGNKFQIMENAIFNFICRNLCNAYSMLEFVWEIPFHGN